MSIKVVAELGSNHCRDLVHTKHLIGLAAKAGADVVKLQLWDADLMYPQGSGEHAAAVRYQLPKDWIPELKDECDRNKVAFMCTAFDLESLDYIDQFVDTHKVASIEATWLPFLDRMNEKRKPVYLSVGAMDYREMDASIRALKDCDVTLLQCVVAYPARIEDYNLDVLCEWLDGGVSDHTQDPLVIPMTAAALGATVIEKHIRAINCDSPDAPHAISDLEFGRMVEGIRNVVKALGTGKKLVQESEKPYLRYRRGPLGLRGA